MKLLWDILTSLNENNKQEENNLEDWQKELVKKGEQDSFNFEEEDLEEDDYYYEDDK